MIYQQIDGYCDFAEYYIRLSDMLPNNAIFVEIGVWKGKSLSVITELNIKKQKHFQIYAIDTWSGSQNEQPHIDVVNEAGGSDEFYLQFLQTMKKYKLLSAIISLKLPSHIASKLFDNESIDCVFIDGDHSYEGVKKDIEYWYPKVKNNGIISGHDYYVGHPPSEPIIRAVNEKFESVEQYYGGVWEYIK